jgi:hypothetical protein
METARLNDTGNGHVDTANYLYRRGSHRSGFADLAFAGRSRIVG